VLLDRNVASLLLFSLLRTLSKVPLSYKFILDQISLNFFQHYFTSQMKSPPSHSEGEVS